MDKGLLISVEGIHGAGKTTVSEMLARKLKGLGLYVILAIDQAGTEIGKEIRKINLESGSKIDIWTEALLIAAARRQNIVEVIKPNFYKRKVIISERFTDAYFAFQGSARGLPLQFLENINSAISEGIMPDLTILLDLDPEIAIGRLKTTPMHRIEREPLEFHRKVRQGYLEQVKKYPKRIRIIDATLPINSVFDKVWEIVKSFLITRGVIK